MFNPCLSMDLRKTAPSGQILEAREVITAGGGNGSYNAIPIMTGKPRDKINRSTSHLRTTALRTSCRLRIFQENLFDTQIGRHHVMETVMFQGGWKAERSQQSRASSSVQLDAPTRWFVAVEQQTGQESGRCVFVFPIATSRGWKRIYPRKTRAIL